MGTSKQEAQERIRQMAERLSEIDGTFSWDHQERVVLNYIEQQEARIAELEQSPAVPEGWRIERCNHHIHIKDGEGRWMGVGPDMGSPALALLYRFFDALLSAQPTKQRPAPAVQGEPDHSRLRARFDEIEREILENKHTAHSVFTQMRTAALYAAPPPIPEAVRELLSGIRTINRAAQHLVEIEGDDEPCYYQRGEWIKWILELADKAEHAILSKPAPQPAEKPVTRQDVIDVLLSTRGQSEGVTADAILGLLPDKATVPTDKPAEQKPDVTQLVEALVEAVEYLDSNALNSIGHGSVLHRQMKEALTGHRKPSAAPCCGDPGDCWEPCGDLGKSEAHVRVSDHSPDAEKMVPVPYELLCRLADEDFRSEVPDDWVPEMTGPDGSAGKATFTVGDLRAAADLVRAFEGGEA